VLGAAGCASHQPAQPTLSQPSAAVRELRSDLARVFGAPINDRDVWAVDIR